MKYIMLLLAFTSAFANSLEDYKFVKVSKRALNIQRNMVNERFVDVEVKAYRTTLNYLNKYLSKSVQSNYNQQLSSSSISEIFSCYHSSNCDVYRISITGSYHSGWSENVEYVLVQDNLDQQIIKQEIYAE